MCRVSRYVAVMMATLCFASSAFAQDRAVLRITVEDALTGTVKGVKLTLVNKVSGKTSEATTDKAGKASFEALGPGEYSLKAEAAGFRALERTVTVGATDPEPVKIKLQVQVTEDVTVTAGAPPVPRTQADQNADTIKLGNGMLQSLPLAIDPAQLEVFITSFLSPMGGGGNVDIIVDGQEVDSVAVPTAAIRSAMTNVNPYSPLYRQVGKARVEIVTEIGSTRHYNWHLGLTSADSKLDAPNAFAQTKPPTHKNFVEMGLSGPIGRKLGSFLVSSERLSDTESSVVNALTPAGPVNSTLPLYLTSTTAFARTDLRLSKADHLSFNVDFVNQWQRNIDVGGLLLPELANTFHATEHRFRVSFMSKLTASFQNEVRFLQANISKHEGIPATGPMLDVGGAFTGGVNPNYLSTSIPTMEFHDFATYFRGKHQIQFGGGMRVSHTDINNATNFGGTFIFANLDQFTAGKPETFSITVGTPTVRYSRPQGYMFFQDEMKLAHSVTLLAGVRYDREAGLNDRENFAPRLALAIAPGKQKTVFRFGTGLFYMHYSDRIREQSTLYDGVHTKMVDIENPSYPNPFLNGQQSTILPSIVRVDPKLALPFIIESSAAIEQELKPGTMFTVAYSHRHGYKVFRALDVNAPLPSTSQRPDPNYKAITQVESTATMRGNGLSFTLASRITNIWKASAMYTFSKTVNNTGGPLGLPADNFNLAAEMGRADYDLRHKFNMATVISLPKHFQMGTVLNLSSGLPYDINTGFDNNGDGHVTDRPVGVTRNTGNGPGFAKLDLRFSKLFFVGRPAWAGQDTPSHVEFNVDVFNVLNRTNLGKPVAQVSSPLFGTSPTALSPRTFQLSLKYFF